MVIYQHVLLTLNLTDKNEKIVKQATKFADLFRARLSLIHVIEPTINCPNAEELELSTCDKAKKAMASLGKKINIPKEDQLIEFGSVKAQVLGVADELRVDMIMVGSHSLSHFLGPTANAIIQGANCDVLVIRNT